MPQISDILANQPLLADGAMGTVLYSRGIFIHRCYDELNLSDPALIMAVHEEYLQAGAQILESNTFGANRFRLSRYGLGGKVAEINTAGVRIAREAVAHLREKQACDAWVAGSVGPLGVRLEPLGKTGLEEARAAFAEQIRALAEAGADLLIIETMPALNEAREALLAAEETAPQLPVLVMVTVDDESNCLDGSSAQHAATLLTEWGAGAVGVNCSTGPSAVLTAIEAMRAATRLPIAAMPNAGMPREVEGRNIYLCSPEYMASFARKAIAAGAQIVGGCCGTTPNHIRAMRTAMRAIEAQARVTEGSVPEELPRKTPPAPLGQRSRLGSLIEQGKFVTLVEMIPPKGIDCSGEIEGAQVLAQLGV
ncbi:MAG: homocysteine S-methyltransferase family protein, partial [Terracidiphilus sp.]